MALFPQGLHESLSHAQLRQSRTHDKANNEVADKKSQDAETHRIGQGPDTNPADKPPPANITMVPLPLFKLASLFVRHVSKYGANRIKAQAHEHPRFRALAAKYGQAIHQLNMKLSVALLRDPEAERRAKEQAEAPTVKTEEQVKREELKSKRKGESQQPSYPRFTLQSVWRRKFRPLPENKAVDLFADVAGDTFILGVAGALIIYEYYKSSQKPDANKERIDELNRRFEELQKKEEELAAAEERQRQRFESLEEALRSLKDPKTKQPLFPSLQANA
ncbi:hypothetical protein CCMA1212_002251 [Trichoderma ghanense]|uniref:Uncharacterized protein n=1 Tax=Trichoderma ghanense TaxID=65468 RepID=A0ABY2HBZ4_9HYPO